MANSRTDKRRKKKPRGGGNGALKWVLITGGVLLMAMFGGLFVVYLSLQGYLKSAAFRDRVVAAAAGTLKAEAELQEHSWEGSSVYADGFSARGYQDAAFSRLEVDGIRVVFDGARDGAWQVPEATAQQVSVEFSADRLKGRYEMSAGAIDPGGGAPPAWLSRFIPQRTEVGKVKAEIFNLLLRDPQGTERLHLRGVEALAEPQAGSGVWDFQGRRGELQLPGMPEMDVVTFEIRWNENELYLTDAAVGLYGDARLEGHGDISLGTPAKLDLELNLSNLDVKKVISPEWKKQISGRLFGEVTVEGSPSKPGGITEHGTIELKNGLLQNLPLLSQIATYTRSDRFKNLVLHQATGDFVRKGERVEITNLVIQSDGLTRLEGDLTLEGNQIGGKFRLGVTAGTLQWIPGAEQKVFKEADKGFLWTDLTVSGTRENPREDLTARLAAAAIETVVEEAPGRAIDAAREAVRDPGSIIDQGTSLLNTLTPLLP